MGKLKMVVDLDSHEEKKRSFSEEAAFQIGVAANLVQYWSERFFGEMTPVKKVGVGFAAACVFAVVGALAYEGDADDLYAKARSLPPGPKKIEYLVKSAERGGADAAFILGVRALDLNGGAAKDDMEAVRWFSKAAELGHPRAHFNLALMSASGRGGRADVRLEAEHYKSSSTIPEAAFNLAVINAEGGAGFPANPEEAVFWFIRAAEKGSAKAMNNLGVMYFTGRGVTKDESRAVTYFLQAANLGDANAQHNLGLVHEQGAGGVPVNVEEALQWYKKAADNGSELSREILRGDDQPPAKAATQGLYLITAGASSSGGSSGYAPGASPAETQEDPSVPKNPITHSKKIR